MHRGLLRAFALATTLAVVLTGIASITDPAPATASVESADFILTAFPQEPDSVRFRDTWGDRRSGGRRHQGTDIMSPRGTEIVAVAGGIVTKLGYSRMSGYNIRIDHGNGWITSYLHLNNDTYGTDDGKGGTWTAFFPTLKVGDEVMAGQVIGYVGDSGNAENTTPHTHFEIKHDDTKMNPYPYLRDAFDRENRFPTTNSRPI
jgi:murein DD-endopeptidase MepM/ murein hydrolase activator NlpD